MKVRYCGAKEQDRMIKNGWKIELPINYQEQPEAIFKRLQKEYAKVKIYYSTTMIRGLHEYFAMVKE